MSTVKIGLVQSAVQTDVDANLRKAAVLIEKAAAVGAQIVCLPELFRSRYFCQSEDYDVFALAESIPGPSTEFASSLAKKLGVVIIVPIFEKRSAGIYHNSAAVIDADGRLLGTYRKMHIPDDPQYYEKFYFTPGDSGFKVFQTRYAKIGILICWDQWFPEGARLTAMQGAEILFYPTAIGWHQDQSEATNRLQHEAWELIQRSHAIANGVYVAVPNRVGKEGEQTFWGNSFIAGPFGNLLGKASSDKEEILLADCDLKEVDLTRRHWPFLRDRRVDAYHDLSKRFID